MTWAFHNRVVHPACAILRWAGFRKWSFRLHDATIPPYRCHLWDKGAMAEMFDPNVFLVLPGTGGSTATTRSTLSPCPQCKEEVFEVVLKPSGRYSLECPKCCADRKGNRVGKLVGAVNMRTGKTKEVAT